MTNVEYVNIDAAYLRDAFLKANAKQAAVSKLMGLKENAISSSLSGGRMQRDILERICDWLGADVEKAIVKETREKQPEAQPKTQSDAAASDSAIQAMIYAANKNNERIISYMQDIGKIMTDMMRESRELRTQVKAIQDQLAVQANSQEKTLAAMADRNDRFFVSSTSIMNKILNQMKYGAS